MNVSTLKSSLFLSLLFLAMTSFSAQAGGGAPMIDIPGGGFKFGPSMKPANVKAFKIDTYEVTYARFVQHNKDWQIPSGKENHPVTEVTYFDAEAFCKAVGKRLPTALEWEKAARGADGLVYPWGNEFNKDNANTNESEIGGSTEVGSYKNGKSPYGAFDMAGNVWEWVASWSSDEKKYRLLYGGSFFDDAEHGKTYSTLTSIPDDSHTYTGFRCAK